MTISDRPLRRAGTASRPATPRLRASIWSVRLRGGGTRHRCGDGRTHRGASRTWKWSARGTRPLPRSAPSCRWRCTGGSAAKWRRARRRPSRGSACRRLRLTICLASSRPDRNRKRCRATTKTRPECPCPTEKFSLIHGEGAPAKRPQPAPQARQPRTADRRQGGSARAGHPSQRRPDGALASANRRRRSRTAVNRCKRLRRQAAKAVRPRRRPATSSPSDAHADKATADAQLKTYYGKAQDVLARANKIIAPITSPRGHARSCRRFGLSRTGSADTVPLV